MVEQAGRTFICSVVFVDLVEFSRKPNAEQVLVKETCNALAAEALEPIAAEDRIVVDTGDGFAITFLADPEDALLVGLKLRDAIEEAMSSHSIGVGRGNANGHIRIGVNLGPVKLGTNFNGHVNIVGDGINVAERIMGFALPGQMLVSRSFYEMVSRLADEYGRLLSFDGTRTDNNARVHALYVAGDARAALRVAEERAVLRRQGRRTDATVTRIIAAAPPAALRTTGPVMQPFTADSPPPHITPVGARTPGAGHSTSWLHDRYKVGFLALVLSLTAAFQATLLMQKWRPASAIDTTAAPPEPAVAAADSGAATATPATPAAPVATPAASGAPPVHEPPAAAVTGAAAPAKTSPVPATSAAPRSAAPSTTTSAPSASAKSPPTTQTAPATPVIPAAKAPAPAPVPAKATLPAPAKALTDTAGKSSVPPTTVRPAPTERKPEPARDEKPANRRPPPPQGLQLPSPAVASPPAVSAKPLSAPAQAVEATPAPMAGERSREPARPPAAAAAGAVIKRSGREPEFPREAAREGLTRGSVRARAIIDSAGNVVDVEILGSRPSRVFDRTVRRAMLEWKFNPGADRRTFDTEIDFKRDP